MSNKELLVLKIALNDTSFDYINIHENDEPEDLALNFAIKNHLTKENRLKLERIIEKQIDILVERDFKLIKSTLNSNRSKTPATPLQIRSSIKEKVPKSQVTLSNKQLDLLYQQKKEERFLSIFQMLNPGRDGKISFGTIASIDVNSPIFIIVQPILNDIKNKKKVLTYKEFKCLMQPLFENLSEDEKEVMLDSSSKWNHAVKNRFRQKNKIFIN